jgi:hypothetical protein
MRFSYVLEMFCGCCMCMCMYMLYVICYGLNNIYMMHAEIRNINRPIICIMRFKHGNTMKYWKYRR